MTPDPIPHPAEGAGKTRAPPSRDDLARMLDDAAFNESAYRNWPSALKVKRAEDAYRTADLLLGYFGRGLTYLTPDPASHASKDADRWQTVPKYPTAAMKRAGSHAAYGKSQDCAHEVYAQMLAIAPKPPVTLTPDPAKAGQADEVVALRAALQREIDAQITICGERDGMREALDAAEDRNKALEEALRPFKAYADAVVHDGMEEEIGEVYKGGFRVSIHTRDLRRARAALSQAREGGDRGER